MVRTEICQSPDLIDDGFDFFSDYQDTRDYAARVCPGILPRLDEANARWLITQHYERRARRHEGQPA